MNNFSGIDNAKQESSNMPLKEFYIADKQLYTIQRMSQILLTNYTPSDFFYTILRMTKRLNFKLRIQLEADLIMINPIKNSYRK